MINLPTNVTDYKHSIVVYYENDIRVSKGVQQLKQISHKDTYLKWHKNIFLPCTYTIATETNTDYDLYLSNIKKIITRFTVYEQRAVRIALDYENGRFFLSGETEDTTMADEFYDIYVHFMKQFQVDSDISHNFDSFILSSYNGITSRRFENYNVGDEINCLAVKYKYDGYKTKMVVVSERQAYYFASAVKILERIAIPEILGKYKNFVFQLETMQDKLIITDVIGVYINRILYAPAPMDTLSFLKYLCLNDRDYRIDVSGSVYGLYTQHEMSDRGPLDCYDGYIFVTAHREYKVKLPTVDLHLIKKFFYAYDGDKKKHVSDFQYDYDDGIYEVMRHPRDYDNAYRFIVLRQRFDRHYPCSQLEYDKFTESNKRWTEHLKKNPISF